MGGTTRAEEDVPQDIVHVLEPEPGLEVHFCPILALPILREQRVRTLPGFHLLSLAAGREALARGSYQLHGQKFPCNSLEYLHPYDKVFICAEDHKAFLNLTSMHYHRYICHELEKRMAERRRLRERAAERQARSQAHAAQRQHQARREAHERQREVAAPANASVLTQTSSGSGKTLPMPVKGRPVSASPAAVAGADAASQLLFATNDPYLGGNAPPQHAEEAFATVVDPYLDTPNESHGPARAGGTGASVNRRAPPLPSPGKRPLPLATGSTSVTPTLSNTTPVTRSVPSEDDVYGDMAERGPKRQRPASAYATAIDSILTNDFDEDE